ncbi:MAG: DUF4082 domain-containing protein [Candidatus Peribacteraceae bacterium]|nr:DUF4082 domain-containing protein [Candidatus Peribacteraceae bacterium]
MESMRWRGRTGTVRYCRLTILTGLVLVVLVMAGPGFAKTISSVQSSVFSPGLRPAAAATNDDSWGVLVMNTDKDRYRTGETAEIMMGVLDPSGEMVCDADLLLTVERANVTIRTLMTKNGTIETTPTCGEKRPGSITPDYRTSLAFDDPGDYTLTLEATTNLGIRRIVQSVAVAPSSLSLEAASSTGNWQAIISRSGATRLFPVGSSPMTINVEFLEDFEGSIRETVPGSFRIDSISGGGTASSDSAAISSEATLTWKVSQSKGSTATFSYLFDAPDSSPDVFTVGPLTLTNEKQETKNEQRSWRIANDASNVSITGTIYSDEGTTPITSGTVAVSVNAAAKVTDAVDAGGQYTVTGLTLTGGSIVTVYIDENAADAVTVTCGSGSSMTGVHLYQNRLIIRSNTGSAANAPAMTNAKLAIADNVADSDISSVYWMTDANATLQLASGKELYIWPGSQFTPGGRVKSHDLEVKGTMAMGTNGLTLSGSFIANAGTFTTSTGTLLHSTDGDAASPESLTLGSNTLSNLTINNGLVGYWKLDDGTGSTVVRDDSGNGAHGTLTGGPTWKTNPVHASRFYSPFGMTFNGTTQMVTFANEQNFDFERTSKFSIGFWSQTTSTAMSAIIAKMSSADSYRGWNILANYSAAGATDAGKIGVQFINTWSSNVFTLGTTADTSLVDGNWHHYLLTYNGSSTAAGIKLYQDGASVAMTTGADGLSATMLNNLGVTLAARTALVLPFAGSLDDVRMYNRVLANSEAIALASGHPNTGSGMYVLGSVLGLSGNLNLQSGELRTGNAYPVTLSGSFANHAQFTSTGTVILDDANQAISGSTVFHNFTKNITSAASLFFDYRSRQSFSGALTLNGAEGNLLNLRISKNYVMPTPVQGQIGTNGACLAGDYNMGVRFTPTVSGTITKLGLRVDTTAARTVRLYNLATQAVLASATVTGVNSTTWVYTDITPVAVTAGTSYVVSERGATYCRYDTATAFTQGYISVLDSRYVAASNNMPTTTSATRMYGFADISFEPSQGSASKLMLDADSGSQDLSFLNVMDNDASGGSTLECLTSNGCVDSGNNTNWAFAETFGITGTIYSDEGTTPITSGTVAVSVNGGAAGTDTVDGGGQYTVSGLAFTGGSIITVYIDNGTPDAVTVTCGSGSSMTGMHLYQNRLILRSNTGSSVNAPAMTNAKLDVADTNGDSDIRSIFLGSTTLTMTGGELFVWPGSEFAPGGSLNVKDVDIRGTLTLGANTATVCGSWDSTIGSFTTSGTVQFSGTGAVSYSLVSTEDSFQNIIIGQSSGTQSGTYVLGSALDVNYAFGDFCDS